MNIVVTGGAGFIGTNSLYYLKNKYPAAKIYSFDIGQPVFPVNDVEYIHGDIRSYTHLKEVLKGAELVFHFAAELGTHETFLNPEVTNDVNINGTLNLLTLAREYNYKLLVASKPNIWLNPYSVSKHAMELYCLMFYKEYGVRVSILEFFSVYGPYQYIYKYQKAVPYFIYRALINEYIPIYGNGEQQADFVYVQDVVKAADLIMEKEIFGSIIEFATGVGTKVNVLAKMIIEKTNSKAELKYLPMRIGEEENAIIIANTNNAKNILNYMPEHNLELGLEKTILFYKDWVKRQSFLKF